MKLLITSFYTKNMVPMLHKPTVSIKLLFHVGKILFLVDKS